MKRIEGRTFTTPFRVPRICEGVEFVNCRFDNYAFGVRPDPAHRPVIRDCRFVNCWIHATPLDGVVVEDTIVEHLGTSSRPGWINISGAAFKHVTLRGKMATLNIQPYMAARFETPLGWPRPGLGDKLLDRVLYGARHPEREQGFKRANAAYYAEVDWALDISGVEAPELTLIGVPAELVRRDSRAQAIVRREKVLDGAWKQLDLGGAAYLGVTIQMMIDGGFEDVVVVAGKRSKNYNEHLRGIDVLRAAGVADEN